MGIYVDGNSIVGSSKICIIVKNFSGGRWRRDQNFRGATMTEWNDTASNFASGAHGAGVLRTDARGAQEAESIAVTDPTIPASPSNCKITRRAGPKAAFCARRGAPSRSEPQSSAAAPVGRRHADTPDPLDGPNRRARGNAAVRGHRWPGSGLVRSLVSVCAVAALVAIAAVLAAARFGRTVSGQVLDAGSSEPAAGRLGSTQEKSRRAIAAQTETGTVTAARCG